MEALEDEVSPQDKRRMSKHSQELPHRHLDKKASKKI
jgi:hypothetical protein